MKGSRKTSLKVAFENQTVNLHPNHSGALKEKDIPKVEALEFCDTVLAFYPREVVKITKRIGKFEKAKDFWLSKPEV